MKINTFVKFEWNKKTQSYKEVICESYEYDGEIALCGGGGGGSGTIELPNETAKTFNLIMTGDKVTDALATDFHTGGDGSGDEGIGLLQALAVATTGDSPYLNKEAFDPSGLMIEAQSRITSFESVTTAIVPETYWDAYHDNAKSKADALFSGSSIDDAVGEFAEKQVDDYNLAANRFSSQMAEANALQSSSNILGMALIEARRVRDLDKFRTALTVENKKQRAAYMQTAIHEMATLLNVRMSSEQAISNQQVELSRVFSILLQEKVRDDIEFDVLDARWDIDILNKAFNAVAAPGGGVMVPDKPSKTASAASGALSGAIAGAALGPAGIIGGALAGAAGGGAFDDVF